MSSSMHLFYCLRCRTNIVGSTLDRLCDHVNEHNDDEHEHMSYGMEWTPEGLARSDYYVEPIRTEPKVPIFLPPEITAADLKFLAEARVIW